MALPSFVAKTLNARQQLAVTAAFGDLGQAEDAPYVNRGAYVDSVNAATGSPLGSPWCANALSRWLRMGGYPLPEAAGATKSWLGYGTWISKIVLLPVSLPCVIVYGVNGVPDHVGLGVGRIVRGGASVMLDIEGNTSLTAYDAEGWIVALKEVEVSRVLGIGVLS